MKDKNQHTMDSEKLISDLFEDFSLLSPSSDFKKATMDKVMLEWSSKPIYTSTKLSTQNRIWIGVAILFSLVLVYLFDIKNIADGTSIINSIQLNETQHSFTKLFDTLSNALMQVPSLVYITTLGISALIVLDKMIHKLSTKTF